jgi:hypothetical protein
VSDDIAAHVENIIHAAEWAAGFSDGVGDGIGGGIGDGASFLDAADDPFAGIGTPSPPDTPTHTAPRYNFDANLKLFFKVLVITAMGDAHEAARFFYFIVSILGVTTLLKFHLLIIHNKAGTSWSHT